MYLSKKKDYSNAESFFSLVKTEDLNAEDYQKWAKIPLDKEGIFASYALLDKALALDANY